MIIELLSNVIVRFLDIVLAFNIPMIPETADEYIHSALEYMATGGGILANYVPMDFFLSLMSVIVTCEIGIAVYRFVMWVLKKVPVAGISD